MQGKFRSEIVDLLASENPLRVAGKVLLLWLGLIVALLVMMFPIFPHTRSQWLWLIIAGPPAELALGLGIGHINAWATHKNPELRPWESILIVLVLLALAIWGIHSVP